jgi:hypothetical protein
MSKIVVKIIFEMVFIAANAYTLIYDDILEL